MRFAYHAVGSSDTSWKTDPGLRDSAPLSYAGTDEARVESIEVSPLRALLFGAIAGATGAVAAVAAAERLCAFMGQPVHFFAAFSPQLVSSITIVALAGAFPGAMLGWLARYSRRFLARILFFTLLMPALWVFAQAFVLHRFAESVARLPIAPFLAASVLYGLFLALARPRARHVVSVERVSADGQVFEVRVPASHTTIR